MIKFDHLNELKAKFEIFKTIFSGIRVIDPVTKEVICSIHGEQPSQSFICYQFWRSGNICENCISMRASNEKRVVRKIGGNNNGIFTVTSLPVQIGSRHLALELIQNVTENLYFENGEDNENPQQIMRALYEHVDHLINADELTGLYNRRYINESLSSLLYDMRKNHQPLSVIYMDVDHFKSINDTYGHDVGDQILQDIAELLRESIRQNEGWAARLGGDEFVLCFPRVDNTSAKKIAERIRIAVSEKEFRVNCHTIHVTCSFGVNTANPEDESTSSQELLELADRNLYLCKNTGRNKVV